MIISVIIPALNEAHRIGELVRYFQTHRTPAVAELIVVDGGSGDATRERSREAGARVIEAERGRARQLNAGARAASGDILYFVHADVRPPKDCFQAIEQAIAEGHEAGCFSYRFDSPSLLLRINAWTTQFDLRTTGGGDQTLFLRREVFEALGGYDETLLLMEDFDLVWRLKRRFSFHIIRKHVIVSARKYENNSYLRVQIANLLVFILFQWNVSQKFLCQLYRRMLN